MMAYLLRTGGSSINLAIDPGVIGIDTARTATRRLVLPRGKLTEQPTTAPARHLGPGRLTLGGSLGVGSAIGLATPAAQGFSVAPGIGMAKGIGFFA
jgi:hypothetical protein